MRLMLACSMLLSSVAWLASYPRGPLFNVEQTWSGPEIVLPQRLPKSKPERSPNDNCARDGEWDRQNNACNARITRSL